MSYEFADGYKIRDQSGLYFMTFTIVGWIDLFSRKIYRDIFLKNMQYCREKKDLSVGAFVIMTNHVHLIWQSTEEITSHDFLMSKLNYIHENPVRAGCVEKAEHYLYSSAANYIAGKGMAEIDFLYWACEIAGGDRIMCGAKTPRTAKNRKYSVDHLLFKHSK